MSFPGIDYARTHEQYCGCDACTPPLPGERGRGPRRAAIGLAVLATTILVLLALSPGAFR